MKKEDHMEKFAFIAFLGVAFAGLLGMFFLIPNSYTGGVPTKAIMHPAGPGEAPCPPPKPCPPAGETEKMKKCIDDRLDKLSGEMSNCDDALLACSKNCEENIACFIKCWDKNHSCISKAVYSAMLDIRVCKGEQ